MSRLAAYWNPWDQLEQLRNEMNSVLSTFDRGRAGGQRPFPLVNVWSREDGLALTAELPGINIDDLDITVTSETVTIRGQRPVEENADGETRLRQERFSEPFTRSVRLPLAVDPQRTEATYERGVLTLKLERPEEHKPKKVTVKAG
jgi:HSP20 family protein